MVSTLSLQDGDMVLPNLNSDSLTWAHYEPNLNQSRSPPVSRCLLILRETKSKEPAKADGVSRKERWRVRNEEREREMIQTDRKWEHLLQPVAMSALLCLPKTRVNRPTFCLCSSSKPVLRAASLQSLQLPCRQFVFLPMQGFFPPFFFFFIFFLFC